MKVAVIGPICKDKNIIGNNVYEQIGGVAYYTGNALSFLGASVSIYGSSAISSNELDKSFVCKEFVQIHAQHTLKFVNTYSKNNASIRAQRTYDFGYNAITLDDVKSINNVSYVILGPLLHNNISNQLIKQLAGNGGKIVLAAQGMIRHIIKNQIIWKYPENVLNVLSFVDYLFVSEAELKYITNMKSLLDGTNFLLEHGAKNIIVTHGEKGSTLCLNNKIYEIKPFPVQHLTDVTGAGDSYMAGFIRALELFDDPVKQGAFAAMTATMSIEEEGYFRGGTADVLKRLGAYS